MRTGVSHGHCQLKDFMISHKQTVCMYETAKQKQSSEKYLQIYVVINQNVPNPISGNMPNPLPDSAEQRAR